MDTLQVALIIQGVNEASYALRETRQELKELSKVANGEAIALEKSLKTWHRVALASAAMVATSQLLSGKIERLTVDYLEFDQAIHDVGTVMPLTEEVLRKITPQLEEASRATRNYYSMSELARYALYDLRSSGLSVEESLAALIPTQRLAIATLGDLNETARLVGRVLNTFGKSWDTSPMEKANRVFVAASNAVKRFQWTGPILAESLAWATAAAQSFNVKFEETLAVLGMLNTKGVAASRAGTMFTAFLRELVQGADKLGIKITDAQGQLLSLAEILAEFRKKYGEKLDVNEIAEIQRVLGEEGSRLVQLLYGQERELVEATNSLGNYNDALKMVETRLEGAEAKLRSIENRWRDFRAEIGKNAARIELGFKSLLLGLSETKFGEQIASWGMAMSLFASKLMLLGGKIGGILSLYKIWQLNKVISAKLALYEAAAVSASAGAMAEDTAATAVNTAATETNTAATMANAAAQRTQAAATMASATATGGLMRALSGLATKVSALGPIALGVGGALFILKKSWDALREAFEKPLDEKTLKQLEELGARFVKVTNPEWVRYEFTEIQREKAGIEARISELSGELARIKKPTERELIAMELVGSPGLSKERYNELKRYKKLKEEIAKLEERKVALETKEKKIITEIRHSAERLYLAAPHSGEAERYLSKVHEATGLEIKIDLEGLKKAATVNSGSGEFVGSFASGGVVPQTGLALVHKGEVIVPPERFREMTEPERELRGDVQIQVVNNFYTTGELSVSSARNIAKEVERALRDAMRKAKMKRGELRW